MRFPRRHLRRVVGSVTHVRTDEPVAALTFDDGPDPVWTPRVLDLLSRHGAAATFFMVGERAAAHPDQVAAVVAGGHSLGNHGWSHRAMTRLDRSERRREVRSTQQTLGAGATRMFRPPWGRMNLRSRLELGLMGYQPVLWNVDIGDWESRDSGSMARALTDRLRPGCIVLLHDSIWDADSPFADRTPVIESLDEVLGSSGLRFVTLPELFTAGEPSYSNWFFDDETRSNVS